MWLIEETQKSGSRDDLAASAAKAESENEKAKAQLVNVGEAPTGLDAGV